MAADLELTIAANLAAVEARIAAACARAGRARGEITLVAVSKTRSPAEILAAYRAGVRHFGENRIEEGEEKIPALREHCAAAPAQWHMIGHVQSRKARRVAALMDVVHAVDSWPLAQRLNAGAAERGVCLPILLEVNVSGEAAKDGFPAADAAGEEAFLREVSTLATLEHVQVRGLMTMAPEVADAEATRPVFRHLRALRDRLRAVAPFSPWDDLSMGMTNDYAVAIEEGATLVRIGRAIFAPGA
jgi:hypothetical protein